MAVATQDNWRQLARRYARKYGLPEDVFERQMGQEAHGQDVTSPRGAQGPAQIMPDTAKAWGVKNPHDINEAYDAAASHMAGYVKQYGSVKNALVAYNAGPGTVGKALPAETQNYLKIVLGGGSGDEGLQRPDSSVVAPVAQGGGGLPGASAATQGTTGNDRLAKLAQTLQTLEAATPHIPYNSPFSRTDDQPQSPTQFSGAPQSSLGQVSNFEPTKVQSIEPTSIGDTLASIATRGGSPTSAPGPTPPGGPTTVADMASAGGEGPGAALSWARARLADQSGSRERGTNTGPLASMLNKQFGMSNQPWCAMFTSAAVTQGGAPPEARTASVAEVRAKALKGQGYQRGFVDPRNAQPGDLILFGNDHIGMVDRVEDGKIKYIGGNQSNTVSRGTASAQGASIVRPRYGASRGRRR